ncbi:hypothetical protein OH738_20790 [Streptomyces hirsutus]|uniref:Uncharacterized protein n=1 Tax=Streptomyces hirsutus TaxID=35620 RepID=A0ABZ1GN69_9ACTN|nr:hypothetical protein [Streptomyces hirsutus]WSD07590.1 hypothetical protein OIE73_18800 [Streptomyces hirsutus]WTD18980.1 hypothetical protein OH738_20790 [Streptomyces hirsutus]WTD76089.1 hypothetical protein OHB56_20695 [Streptomyces sp. NBC_01635]
MLERIRTTRGYGTARRYARGFVAAVVAVAALVLAANAGPAKAVHPEKPGHRTTSPVEAAVR